MKTTALALILILQLSPPASAALAISFGFGDPFFSGDESGDTAGPFTDPDSGITGTMTTTAVLPAGGTPNLETGAGALGIDSDVVEDDDFIFDPTESWSFSWNVATEFIGIDFAGYDLDPGAEAHDQFTISSPDWVGRSITPGSNVTFISATGTFVFDVDETADNFNIFDIGGAVATSLGAVITISFADIDPAGGLDDGGAVIEGISFNLVSVPEPSSFVLGGLICCALGLRMAQRRLLTSGSSKRKLSCLEPPVLPHRAFSA